MAETANLIEHTLNPALQDLPLAGPFQGVMLTKLRGYLQDIRDLLGSSFDTVSEKVVVAAMVDANKKLLTLRQAVNQFHDTLRVVRGVQVRESNFEHNHTNPKKRTKSKCKENKENTHTHTHTKSNSEKRVEEWKHSFGWRVCVFFKTTLLQFFGCCAWFVSRVQ